MGGLCNSRPFLFRLLFVGLKVGSEFSLYVHLALGFSGANVSMIAARKIHRLAGMLTLNPLETLHERQRNRRDRLSVYHELHVIRNRFVFVIDLYLPGRAGVVGGAV